MKKSLIFSVIICLSTISGCSISPSLSTDQKENNDNSIVVTGSTHQDPLTNDLPGPANEHTFLFSGTDTESVTMHHNANEPIKLFFINDHAKSMKVTITFANTGDMGSHLRLSQIIMPDGSMDGPFGQNTTYDLTQYGGYQLIFSENMMAGDPWTGDATITVRLY